MLARQMLSVRFSLDNFVFPRTDARVAPFAISIRVIVGYPASWSRADGVWQTMQRGPFNYAEENPCQSETFSVVPCRWWAT